MIQDREKERNQSKVDNEDKNETENNSEDESKTEDSNTAKLFFWDCKHHMKSATSCSVISIEYYKKTVRIADVRVQDFHFNAVLIHWTKNTLVVVHTFEK